jgi:hypothetical protein
VVSKHSGCGRAQSPLHRARDSEDFSAATSPKCVRVKNGSLLWAIDTGEGVNESIGAVNGGGETIQCRDESKKVGLR